jgi:hypothetical protein
VTEKSSVPYRLDSSTVNSTTLSDIPFSQRVAVGLGGKRRYTSSRLPARPMFAVRNPGSWPAWGTLLVAAVTILTVAPAALAVGSVTSPHPSPASVIGHGSHLSSGVKFDVGGGTKAGRAVDSWLHAHGHGPSTGHVTEVNGSLGVGNAEVESAIDPSTHFIYEEWMSAYGIAFARSTDDGASFHPALVIPGSENFFNATTFASSWDPAVAVAPDGIVYAAYMYSNSTTIPAGEPMIAVSFDHGRNFAYERPIFSAPNVSFNDRDFIAVGPDGTVYATWNYAPDASLITFLCSPTGSCSYAAGDFNLAFAYSTDHGRTWSTPKILSPNYPRGGTLEGPIATDREGIIYVQYDRFPTAKNYTLSPGQEWFTMSSDHGRHWSSPVLLSGSYRVALTTWWIEDTLVASPDGRVFFAFDAQTATQDVGFVRYSLDEGRQWSPLIRATPDVDAAPHIMQLAATDGGRFYVGWLTMNTSAGWTPYLATVATESGIVSTPFHVSLLYGDSSVWPGDTIGLVYLGHGRVSVCWGSQVTPENDGIFEVLVHFHHRHYGDALTYEPMARPPEES